ncbi:MAG: aminodeoxychorismate synthase component I [Sandarakinorhabdus sp.]|nr:aminodeoxychorismate synthase component I [Sandarakinorhabdus sp.]
MFDPALPFVLLDDVAAGSARLFSGVCETVFADSPEAVPLALTHLQRRGPWAGYVGFEAGYALEAALPRRLPPIGEPLLWFGRFARDEAVDAAALMGQGLGLGPAHVGDLAPLLTQADHEARLAQILALITAGDIYQANLTFNAVVAVGGHPLHLYARLRAGSRAPYGALVFTGSLWILSFSPELFFKMDGPQLMARPMKGTAPRGLDTADDEVRAAVLGADPKNRAENLMITDLLRNDLSRVGDNVQVPALFAVETYPTVLQMTSTITATAHDGISAADVLTKLFPCGSVTGAPKIRAMQVIADVEAAPRGVYTGSIGAIAANGDAIFNVAIRTLVMAPQATTARLGIGSGIVADSDADSEWAECLAKATFLHRRGPPDLVETLRAENGDLPDLGRHLDRMAASAAFLGTAFNAEAARALVCAASRGVSGRIRLLAAPSGALAVQVGPLPVALATPVRVAITALPVSPDDWRLRHKTSDRRFYDDARAAIRAFEVIFATPAGGLTEGSFTNLFVRRGGVLLTPPASLGLLPGVLRAGLLASGEAVEANLTAADLGGGFFIGNALRGLIPAILA